MIGLFENANVVVGLILTVFGAFSSVVYWFNKRLKDTATKAVTTASGQSSELKAKVSEIEGDLRRVAANVDTVKRDVGTLDDRVHDVERTLETVARQGQVAELNAEVKQLSGSMTAKLEMVTGMLHSFRESALRSAERGDGK